MYNSVVHRPGSSILLAVLMLASCNRAPQNKEAVRQGVLEHLSKNSGLDMSAIDVDVTNIAFKGEEANATVSFRAKASPDQGMTLNYTLGRQGGKWLVMKKADSGTHSGSAVQAPQTGELPAGHPPTKGPGAATELPPGHPPLKKPESRVNPGPQGK